jgi:hypothetical protein
MIKYLAILAVLLSACANEVPRVEEPKNCIPKGEMIEVLTEMVKLEAYVADKYIQVNKYHKVMMNTGDSLLKANGYSRDQFDNSMDYYTSRQLEMQDIYTEVLENLNEELGELESQK